MIFTVMIRTSNLAIQASGWCSVAHSKGKLHKQLCIKQYCRWPSNKMSNGVALEGNM